MITNHAEIALFSFKCKTDDGFGLTVMPVSLARHDVSLCHLNSPEYESLLCRSVVRPRDCYDSTRRVTANNLDVSILDVGSINSQKQLYDLA